jgi:hypothetical protein
MHTCMHVCGGHRCPDALSAGTTMPARPRWTSTSSTSSDTRAGRRSSAHPALALASPFPSPFLALQPGPAERGRVQPCACRSRSLVPQPRNLLIARRLPSRAETGVVCAMLLLPLPAVRAAWRSAARRRASGNPPSSSDCTARTPLPLLTGGRRIKPVRGYCVARDASDGAVRRLRALA